MRLGTALAASVIAYSLSVMPAASQGSSCTNPNALGVSRTVEIDTTGGPGFGFEHYKEYDFLVLKEVVLTFDDGPQVGHTHAILKALADHCTKATFFSVGKMAAGLPEILRDVAKGGHTVGTHTWAHIEITKLKDEAAWKAEIEKGISAARRPSSVIRASRTPRSRSPICRAATSRSSPPTSTPSTSSSRPTPSSRT
jgi:peptidoglycan/xylan/chitin deacetylase (PgdA/CDA1 family)